jgi:hypothetical protein
MKPTREAVASGAKAQLAKVESLLRQTDDADDQLGAHAADADEKLRRELAKRGKSLGPAGDDPDADAEQLYLLGHRRRAQQVAAIAARAKASR